MDAGFFFAEWLTRDWFDSAALRVCCVLVSDAAVSDARVWRKGRSKVNRMPHVPPLSCPANPIFREYSHGGLSHIYMCKGWYEYQSHGEAERGLEDWSCLRGGQLCCALENIAAGLNMCALHWPLLQHKKSSCQQHDPF